MAAALVAATAGLTGGQMACTILFGTTIFTYLGLEISRLRVLLRDGVDPSQRHTASKHSEPLSMSFPSLYAFFRDMSALGLILLLAFMCEKFPLYAQGGKEWDRDMYWFLCLLLLVASIMTMRKGKCTDILNRDQTEEWKGWMQFMFLFYHYYHAEEVYNAIRIMITCYVWMTGFGNFSFFYIKQDFGFVRFVQMLWRLNFLVTLLCLSQNNTYILYYICPLHTFYFGLVYLTMRIAPQHNHGKWDVRFKLMLVGVLIYIVWDCFGGQIFSLIFGTVLSKEPAIGAKSGSLWEWYFRTSLDHWSTMLGMIFALNFPMATRWLTKVEEQPVREQIVVKGIAGLIIAVPFVWWAVSIFPQSKLDYNLTNSYCGFIPLLFYIYFRNLTPGFRSWYSGLLHDIGKVTLETYLMQHHVWLTSNAKTLLVLLPNYPKCNLVVTSVLFVYLSRQIFYITMSLRGMVLPDDRRRCILGTVASVGLLVGLYGLGWVLSAVGLGFLTAALLAVVTGAILLGIVHRRLNLNLWGQVRTGPSGSGGLTGLRAPSSPDSIHSLGRIVCTVLMAGFLLYMPLREQAGGVGVAPTKAATAAAERGNKLAAGASPIAPSMASTSSKLCLKLLSDGMWTCPTADKALCKPEEKVWTWNAAAECNFHTLSSEELKALYRGKEVVMVGDSLGRQYYHNLLAVLGSPSPLAHDPNAAKHQDLHFQDDTEGLSISFLWRPYAKDVQDQLEKWNGDAAPDVVLLSFGLWDTLHETVPDDYDKALAAISAALKGANEKKPGLFRIWLLPTTIVNEKLQTAEKKAHMTEADVAAMRQRGLASSLPANVNAILDGAKITGTEELAGRSHDGVHYDDGVYVALAEIASNGYATFAAGAPKKHASRTRRRLVLRDLDDVEDWEAWVPDEDEETKPGAGGEAPAPSFFHRILKGAGGPKEIDGSMSSPAHGAFVLVVIAIMLLTMDSYGGASSLGLLFGRSDVHVTWEEAYEPLLSKILRSSPPPTHHNTASTGSLGNIASTSSSSGHGSAVRGRYTPVPQGEIELGSVDQPLSPSESGPVPNEE